MKYLTHWQTLLDYESYHFHELQDNMMKKAVSGKVHESTTNGLSFGFSQKC